MLVPEFRADTWTVTDTAGGVWWPSDDTAREIEEADDPEAAAVEICRTTPMRGVWHD